MARLADFSTSVKKALAERAGFTCSFPDCEALTIGPSEETPTSSSRTGMACHIYAAADGPAARRKGHNKTIEQLRSIENGVWMCYNHGKLIDTDECRYTPELLLDWRRLAERKANLRQTLGREINSKDLSADALAKVAKELILPDLMREIADAIKLSCLTTIWGTELALAARDLAIELGQNALTHGNATKFQLDVTSHSLVLSDDGSPFSLVDLERSSRKRGGAMALNELRRRAPELVISHARYHSKNVTTLATTSALDELLEANPCVVDIHPENASIPASLVFVAEDAECDTSLH